ncbi:MAG: tol-pal system protein YbgF [Cyclobacteriaceae bacterium]|nr:tol-pal system protein YbgF [Cyclobacteriaceae bacterium]
MRFSAIFLLFFTPFFTLANAPLDSTKLLLSDLRVQIDATAAINAMYNFDFDESERLYRELRFRYPDHPLSYFLSGLNIWWRIMPNEEDDRYDKRFLFYMDQTISIAEPMLEKEETKIEGAFFLAAAYGFKGRLYSNRQSWSKAASAGKSALDNIEISKEESYLSPELLFGEALYNFYSVWIPENYGFLKPIMMFFPKGDKELGLKQLKEVSSFAFYTRIEGQIFLMRILSSEYNNHSEALRIAEYLHKTYPSNPIFHRYYVRYLYSTHGYQLMEVEAKNILLKIDSAALGYEATSGRYAAFFLGQLYEGRNELDSAKFYYKRAVAFGEENEAYETGYFLYSLLGLARIADEQGEKAESKIYLKRIKKYADRKSPARKAAKAYLKKKKDK